MKLKTIERAERNIERARKEFDNADLAYWIAFLAGAKEQMREGQIVVKSAEPIVCAVWEKKTPDSPWTCSNCGEEAMVKSGNCGFSFTVTTSYCPCCGAKMTDVYTHPAKIQDGGEQNEAD